MFQESFGCILLQPIQFLLPHNYANNKISLSFWSKNPKKQFIHYNKLSDRERV